MPSDKIIIRDLAVSALIGTNVSERRAPQPLILNIEISSDCAKAAGSDRLEDAVDYHSLSAKITRLAENSSFRLLETLASEIASVCLKTPGVSAAAVTVDKPGAVANAKSAAVRIERSAPKGES
jgi:FolB domain-containing protein